MSTDRVFWTTVVVVLASLSIVLFGPQAQQIQTFATIPAVAGLLALLGKIWIDYFSARSRIEGEQTGREFGLAITSHMASRVFDEQANFVTAYAAKTNEVMSILFANGPCQEALDSAAELAFIRRAHTPWLSKSIEEQLHPFEQTLREIGSLNRLLKHVEPGDKRTKLVDEEHRLFGILIEIEGTSEENADVTITKVIERLRDLIGVPELTKLRAIWIAEASRRLDGNST